jgi:hypothetical protein
MEGMSRPGGGKAMESLLLTLFGVAMVAVLLSAYGSPSEADENDDPAVTMTRAAESLSENRFVRKLLGER